MSGIINIAEHNAKIEEIEISKAAIRIGARVAEESIEATKPKCQLLAHGKIKIVPKFNGNGSIRGFGMTLNEHDFEIEYPNTFGRYKFIENEDVFKSIAACIIKAFGPIPQELIDSVVVE